MCGPISRNALLCLVHSYYMHLNEVADNQHRAKDIWGITYPMPFCCRFAPLKTGIACTEALKSKHLQPSKFSCLLQASTTGLYSFKKLADFDMRRLLTEAVMIVTKVARIASGAFWI